ncbi:MAG: PadR family transcriptional regulator [bacterium]|nr:PadR family transcriptional regulator [bacterium]
MRELTIPEQTLLLAIWRLKDEAYGVSIRKKVEEVTKKDIIYGTLYNLLDQLVRKGYVLKSRGEPTAERGGRSKIYYRLTEEGVNALEAARDLQKSLWEGIPEALTGK